MILVMIDFIFISQMNKLNEKRIHWNRLNSQAIPRARWSGKQKQTEDENFRLKTTPDNELMGC